MRFGGLCRMQDVARAQGMAKHRGLFPYNLSSSRNVVRHTLEGERERESRICIAYTDLIILHLQIFYETLSSLVGVA